MTDDLTDLEALAQSATPGPWKRAVVDGMGFAVHRGEHDTIALYADRADAAFIAAARAAVPALIARVRKAEAERDEARAALARVEALAEALIEQGDEHVEGCEGQADCAACVHHDLRAVLAGGDDRG